MLQFGFQSTFSILPPEVKILAYNTSSITTIVSSEPTLKEDTSSREITETIHNAVNFGKVTNPEYSFIPLNDLTNFIHICGAVCEGIEFM